MTWNIRIDDTRPTETDQQAFIMLDTHQDTITVGLDFRYADTGSRYVVRLDNYPIPRVLRQVLERVDWDEEVTKAQESVYDDQAYDMTDALANTVHALLEGIDEWSVWPIEDWLHDTLSEVREEIDGMTDKDVRRYADMLEDEAEASGVCLLGDVVQYLREVRDDPR